MKRFVVLSATAALSNFDVSSDVFLSFDEAQIHATEKAKMQKRDFLVFAMESVARVFAPARNP